MNLIVDIAMIKTIKNEEDAKNKAFREISFREGVSGQEFGNITRISDTYFSFLSASRLLFFQQSVVL